LRPISLLPTLAKIFESIVGRWLVEKLSPYLDPNQFGSLRGRSTTDALVSLLHQWCTEMDSGGSVRAVFVDFAKAFDRVDHNLLIKKLLDKNIPHFLVKWFHSYLSSRKQRIRLAGETSTWTTLVGGMPQGSWLGALSFIILIDDLKLDCTLHKYVDDTTLSEFLPVNHLSSCMDSFIHSLLLWTSKNSMKVNFTKSKEMVLGPVAKASLPSLIIENNSIERVTQFKLLGVHITCDLNWQLHVESICSKAGSRLYYLKQLKRAGLPSNRLRLWYLSVVRPVLEYCSAVWHHGLTKAQSEKIESIQRRALRIIFPSTVFASYQFALDLAQVPSLTSRRDLLCRRYFNKLTNPSYCIHHLLPPPRCSNITSRLRQASIYPRPRNRTNRYTSFINFALSKYQ
jgi:hypothetical protein